MHFITYISELIIPIFIFYIIATAITKKIDAYTTFTKGAMTGLNQTVSIFPTLIGLFLATKALSSSGLLNAITNFFSSAEIAPAIIRFFSASAANGIVFDIFKQYGTDSYEGICISIMMSCTETVFYTLSIYFASVKIKRTRYTLPGALLCTLAGIIASIVISHFV